MRYSPDIPEILRHLRVTLHRMESEMLSFVERSKSKEKELRHAIKKSEVEEQKDIRKDNLKKYLKSVKDIKNSRKAAIDNLHRAVEILEVSELDSTNIRKRINTFCRLFEDSILHNGEVPTTFLEIQSETLKQMYISFKKIDNDTNEVLSERKSQDVSYLLDVKSDD